MFLNLLIIVVLFLISYVFWVHYNSVKQMKNVPGPKEYFFIGSALETLVTPVELFNLARVWAGKFKDCYKFMTLHLAIINIYNPEDIETVVSSTKHNDKGFVYSFLQPWLGDGLLLSKGKKWHNRRKILTPTFHFNILSKFCETFDDLSQKMAEGLKSEVDQPFDACPLVTELTLNAMRDTAMGNRVQEDDTNWKKYKDAIFLQGELLVQRFCTMPYFFDFIYRLSPSYWKQKKSLQVLHGFTKHVIDNRIEYLKSNTGLTKKVDIRRNKHMPMLDLLIAAENEGLIDHLGIQEEVDTFMFEGHDTTASGLTFCLMALANNEQIQENIFKELDNIFGNSQRRASMEDLSNMKYLERCIKESLRLYPPVHFINRIINDEVTISGHKIPAGSVCNIHIYDLHRREDLFPNPKKFDPDRFLPENCIDRHPYAYIPFSAGPRNCIGQRFAMLLMKSALSSILRRYKLLPVTTPQELTLTTDLVLRNSGPVYVMITHRRRQTTLQTLE